MDFNNLHVDCNCDCVKDALPDTESHYVLKTMKNFLREQDFKSYWEKGKRDEDCEKICSFKGTSVSVFNEETKEEISDIYKELFPVAPKYKPYFTVLKFGENCGVTKHTPEPRNPHHHDFFKCDTFIYTDVILIESTLLFEENV